MKRKSWRAEMLLKRSREQRGKTIEVGANHNSWLEAYRLYFDTVDQISWLCNHFRPKNVVTDSLLDAAQCTFDRYIDYEIDWDEYSNQLRIIGNVLMPRTYRKSPSEALTATSATSAQPASR